MLGLLQLFTVCATLAQCFGAPWDTNNNIREFDLEWQCEQFCNRLKGNLHYNVSDSSCICTVDTRDKIEYNKHLENKLHDLGFNFKIIDKTEANKVVKRDITHKTADKIRKILAESNQSQIGNPLEANNDVIQNAGPNPETEEKEEKIPISEKLHRLRSKFLIPKNEKDITSAPDNFVLSKATPNMEIENKEEDYRLKLSPKRSAPENEIKSNAIVALAAPEKEEENVENKENSANERMNQLRLKLAALKNTRQEPKNTDEENEKKQPLTGIKKLQQLHIRPTHVGNEQPSNNEEKPISEKIRQLRERLRMRLQSKKLKSAHPNEDGDEGNLTK